MAAAQEAAGELGLGSPSELPSAFGTPPQGLGRVSSAAFPVAPSAPREQSDEMFRAPTTVVQLPGLAVPPDPTRLEPTQSRILPVINTAPALDRLPDPLPVARPSIVVDDAEQWIAQHMVSTGTRITKKDSDTLKSHPQYVRKVLYRCSRYKVKDRRCQVSVTARLRHDGRWEIALKGEHNHPLGNKNGAGVSLPSRRQMNRWLQLCEMANARADGEALIESSLLVLAEKIQSPPTQS